MGRRDLVGRAAEFARSHETQATGALHRVRRLWLIARVGAAAQLRGARVSLVVDPSVRIDRGVRVVVGAGTHNVLSIGAGSRLGRDLVIELVGGELHLGAHVDLRAGVILNVAGRLRFEGPNLVQAGAIVHCDDEVTVGTLTVLSERTTVVDSSHFHSEDVRWFLDNVRTAPVHIGSSCWIGAKATITRGVSVGDRCVVGSNSTVITDVPEGHLVSGVPAQVVRELHRGP